MATPAADARADRRSMSEAAYAELKRRILRNEIAPGAQFLEQELAVALGMSRTPLREAAVRLQNEGLVEITPRRGLKVAPLSKRDIREINEVLEVLEVQAAERLAARRVSTEELRRLEEAVAAMDAALERDDQEGWGEADYAFHGLLIELCGSRRLTEVARQFLDRAHRFRLLTLPLRARPVYSNVNHAAVVEAIRRNDPQTAQDIHRAHKRRWARELADLLDRMDLPG